MNKDISLTEVKLKSINGISRIGEGIEIQSRVKTVINVKVASTIVNENKNMGVVIMDAEVRPDLSNDKRWFTIKAEVVGMYQSKDEVTVEDMKSYSIETGHKELWPYLKQDISNIAQSMGISIQLPPNSPIKEIVS